MIGSSASERAFQSPSPPFRLAPYPADRVFANCAANSAASARRTACVGPGQISAGNQSVCPLRAPLVGWNGRIPPLGRLTIGVASRARARGPLSTQRFRSDRVPDGHAESRRRPRRIAVTHPSRSYRSRPRRGEFGFKKLFDEAANARAHPSFQGSNQSSQRKCSPSGVLIPGFVLSLSCVISVGALTPILVCFHKLEIRHLKFQPPPRRTSSRLSGALPQP